jgi:hypothetical protein
LSASNGNACLAQLRSSRQSRSSFKIINLAGTFEVGYTDIG